jgi:hypothetical protein
LVRLRHSKGVERQQVKWFAYALAVLATSSTLSFVVSDTIGIRWLGQVTFVLVMAGVVGLPVAVGIAILKYRLYNIDVLINDRSASSVAPSATLTSIAYVFPSWRDICRLSGPRTVHELPLGDYAVKTVSQRHSQRERRDDARNEVRATGSSTAHIRCHFRSPSGPSFGLPRNEERRMWALDGRRGSGHFS